MNDRFLSLLGIIRRAGRLELGFDAAKESIQNGKGFLLITSSDISQRSKKELAFFARENEKIIIRPAPYTIDDFNKAVGKKVKIISICDEGFGKKALELLSTSIGEE